MFYNAKFNSELEQSFGIDSTNSYEPAKDSFLYKAFQKNMQCAQKSLESGYIQGIKNASLNPDYYGAFMIQDAFYCIEGVKTLEIASSRAERYPQVKKVIDQIYKFYKDYVDTVILPNWTIKSTDSIEVRNGFRAYSAFERLVAQEKDSIYILITLLPCYYLWAWITTQLKDYEENNIYGGWIKENQEMLPSILINDTIEAFCSQNPTEFNEAEALNLFSKAMDYEWNNFIEASL